MVKYFHWTFAIFIIQISAFAWAGAVVDMPVGDAGKVRYGVHGLTPLQGAGISMNELIYGTKTLDISARMSFTTGKGMGQSGDSLLYGPGGGFVIRGCIEEGGRCAKGSPSSIGVRGTFLSAKLVDENGKLMLIATFVEKLNPILAAMLGVPVQSVGTLDLLLSNSKSCGWAVDNVEGGSLNILSEPSSLVTFGSSLLGLFLTISASVILRRGNTGTSLER